MDFYVNWVNANPLLSAVIQFAILGTLGDLIARWIIQKKVTLPYKPVVLLFKMAEWAVLAIFIKYAFTGFTGFVSALSEHNLLPELTGFWKAFSISVAMNLQFGPFLVIMHRILDNLVERENNWKNLDKGFYSLLWFWIPAHTVTFMLPPDLRIGLAAIWSVMLGVILGFYNRKR